MIMWLWKEIILVVPARAGVIPQTDALQVTVGSCSRASGGDPPVRMYYWHGIELFPRERG